MQITENKNVRQRPDEGFRRWFVNDYFDIIFWYESDTTTLKGFQFCYSRNNKEKVFTWEPGRVSSHYVSSNQFEPGMSSYATAILDGDAGAIPQNALERLKKDAGELQADYVSLIIDRAEQYNQSLQHA